MKPLNSRGFTMIEMLVSFSIFSLIASFLPLLMNIVLNNEAIEARNQRMEWELFVSQLKREIQMSDDMEVANGELVLFNNRERITIQKYGKLLRRLVNRKGHEVVLQNVESVRFEKENRRVIIEVKDTYSNAHTAAFYTFINRGNLE